jgi:hypothetical protein
VSRRRGRGLVGAPTVHRVRALRPRRRLGIHRGGGARPTGRVSLRIRWCVSFFAVQPLRFVVGFAIHKFTGV